MSDSAGSLIGIRAAVSAFDPGSCSFAVNRSIMLGGPVTFSTDHYDAALAAAIRSIPGVRDLALADNIVTVAKDDAADWAALKPAIASEIRAYLIDGPGSLPRDPAPLPVKAKRSPAAVRAAAQKVLDERFNPAIASHSGSIAIVDLVDDRLHVVMSGGCQGCAASQLTLRSGLAQMLRRDVPEIVDIIDTTLHAKGTSPFIR